LDYLIRFLIGGDNFDQDVAAPWAVELGEEDTLPCPQHQPTVFNEQHSGISQKAGFDMGRRIALGMAIVFMLRRDSIKLGGDVRHDSGVGVLIDQDTGGGMGHKDVAKAVFNAAFPHDIPDFPGDVPEFYSRTGFNVYSCYQAASPEFFIHILHPGTTAGNTYKIKS
jgi:hypothetical protein